jgi:hypothetical protein
MPTVAKVVDLKIPEAVLLADLYEIESDLVAAEHFCKKAMKLALMMRRDLLAEEGLVLAAIIKYTRCFNKGTRLSLKRSDIVGLHADQMDTHNYFFKLRDKYVAHAINEFERTYVTVTVAESDGVLLPITSLNAGQQRIRLTAGMAKQLLELIANVKVLLKEMIFREESVLLKHIQSLPSEDIRKFDMSVVTIDHTQVDKSRHYGVNSNLSKRYNRHQREKS